MITQDQNKLQIKPIELPQQKPIKANDCYIELFDNCLHYVMDFVAEEPKDEEDETLGTEEIRSSFNIWITRYNVAAIEKSLNSNKRWLVLISISGMSEDIIVYFNSETSANALHERLVKWRFDK